MRAAWAAAATLAALSILVGCGRDEGGLDALLDRAIATGAPGVLLVERERWVVLSVVRGFADTSGAVAMLP
ncbi:MAG TPA: hypothetical protein VFO56_05420, partial [Gaiellaceae bacterium]|nr:hypothetical protein [Gaiellaceae bacterium]